MISAMRRTLLVAVGLLSGPMAASSEQDIVKVNVETEVPTRKVKVYQFMLPEKNKWWISKGNKKICEGGPYTNWYAEAPSDCKLPTGSYSITCCDTRSKEGWAGGYVLIEGDNKRLCEKFEWNAGKDCYTEKFGVVVPTPKPTPVPTPKPTLDPNQFGMYDFQKSPGPGWVLINSVSELNKVKDQFIKFYNKNKGIPAIKGWKSGNCCWTFASGKRIGIGKYMVPYQGVQRCNGAAYTGVFQFLVAIGNVLKADLPPNTQFTEVSTCGDNHNPAIYRSIRWWWRSIEHSDRRFWDLHCNLPEYGPWPGSSAVHFRCAWIINV